MINLLPPQEKTRIKKEKKLKLILNLGLLFFLVSFSLALILLSVTFHLQGKLLFQEETLKRVQSQIGKEQEKDVKDEIRFYSEAAERIISNEKEKKLIIQALENVNSVLPDEVEIRSFSYNKEDSKISLSGFSLDRASLIAFKSGLEQKFENVKFPPSSWTQGKDIEFNVHFTFK